MTYRSYSSTLAAVLALVAFAPGCSDDPDEPFSGAPSSPQDDETPRNTEGPVIVGVDDSGDPIFAPAFGAVSGTMAVPSGAMAGPSGAMAGPSGVLAVPSGAMAGPSGVLAVPSGVLGEPSAVLGGGGSCDAVAEVFQVSCAGGNCHGAGSNIGDFAAGEAEALALVDVPLSIFPGPCGSYIDSANPLQSAIWRKVEDPACAGGTMPTGAGATPLNASQLDCLQDWLENL